MYKVKHFVIYSLSSFYVDMEAFLLELEWELYDTINSESKVFRIPGETPKNNNIYVHFYTSGSTLYVYIYNDWNNTTHIGTHILYYGSFVSRSFSSYPDYDNQANVFCCGTKDYAMFIWGSYSGGIGQFYGNFGLGYIPDMIYSFKQTCVSPVTAGTDVLIQLDNLGPIKKNHIYQLIDLTGNLGCELVTVTDVNTTNNTALLKNVVNSYPNGVNIGINYYNAFLITGYTMYDLWSYLKIGTAYNSNNIFEQNDIFYGYNDSYAPIPQYLKDHINPNVFINKPFYKKDTSMYPFGYFKDNIVSVRSILERNYVKTFIGVNDDGSFIKTNYSYPTAIDTNLMYIEDIRRNWPVNSLVGKYVGFIAGTGAWQTRKIESNTATRINFVNKLTDVINFTSQYIVVDKVYRVITAYGNNRSNLFALDIF